MIVHLCIIASIFQLVSNAPVRKITPTSTSKGKIQHKTIENVTLPGSFQHTINYETLGGGLEGDMRFPPNFNPYSTVQTKGVATAGYRTWPDNVIPYDLSEISSEAHRDYIVQAMQTLMYAVANPMSGQGSRTPCVYFRPRTAEDQYYVRITYGEGCSGTVGYWPGTDMVVTLADPGCFYSGIIQHELIHVLGFYHEQSRPDRDSYVSVYYENIEPAAEYNFNKFQWGRTVLDQNTPYDLQSIMHCNAYAFSSNGQPTILPLRSNVQIGQRERLSPIDIAEIRDYYRC